MAEMEHEGVRFFKRNTGEASISSFITSDMFVHESSTLHHEAVCNCPLPPARLGISECCG
jgi:hypothetical protein